MTNQAKETEAPDTWSSARGYSSLLPAHGKDEVSWRQFDGGDDLELSAVHNNAGFEDISEDMLLEYLKVQYHPYFPTFINISFPTPFTVPTF